MRFISIRMAIILLLVSWASSVYAVRYGASLNQAEWQLQSSPFECRMWQPVPHFGDAVFSNKAGHEQAFYLAPTRQAMKEGKASLVSTPPVWDESRSSHDMGTVDVKASKTPVRLGKQRSYQLINELYDGMSPTFKRASWYQDDENVELFISSVNFRKAYRQYQDCLATLLPVNFDQIQRSRIHFHTGKSELTGYSKTRLNHIVQYLTADPSVTALEVRGHTDNTGKQRKNLELSKERAETVTRFLVDNGIDESMIATSYHGERYATGNSAKARAADRRVTIRLNRGDL